MSHDTIVVLDYGSQYSQLIARRVRESNVFCELFSWRTPAERILALNPKGIILSGGPESVYADGAPTLPKYVLESGVPVLGICYGMQLLTHVLGGKVAGSEAREFGQAQVTIKDQTSPLFKGMDAEEIQVWMSHGDKVEQLPAGFESIAATSNAPFAAAVNQAKNYYCVQFHPEVNHTLKGRQILGNFVLGVCGAKADWTAENFIQEQVEAIRAQVGNGRVLLGLSGGVDSAVAGALIHKAIGDQLVSVFIDHGMLRLNEGEQVVETFQKQRGMNMIPVNAVEEYLDDLAGVTDPEQKRKIIGNKFVRIFEREANKLIQTGKIDFLAQGTIYPDVIESAAADRPEAHTIKTHHNVGGLPDDMEFELVEPLRWLFKDEVRKIGTALGLPDEIVWRQPFPGPGLAIRCLGEITWERLEKLRLADDIFTSTLRKAGLLKGATAQAFAVLLPVKSVGVMGDQRTYEEVVALRAVSTEDFMTADWARLDYELLSEVSRRIVNEVRGINRVTYDITSKPPGTIEWE
ncbi:MAG: GMP synthase (glutamine-hydrolyzing) [Cellvibrionaceae bacterium]|jgi:GMP synthase (glutamine-hydrolysing)